MSDFEYRKGVPAWALENVRVSVMFSKAFGTWGATVDIDGRCVVAVDADNDDENNATAVVSAALRDFADYVESQGVDTDGMVLFLSTAS